MSVTLRYPADRRADPACAREPPGLSGPVTMVWIAGQRGAWAMQRVDWLHVDSDPAGDRRAIDGQWCTDARRCSSWRRPAGAYCGADGDQGGHADVAAVALVESAAGVRVHADR